MLVTELEARKAAPRGGKIAKDVKQLLIEHPDADPTQIASFIAWFEKAKGHAFSSSSSVLNFWRGYKESRNGEPQRMMTHAEMSPNRVWCERCKEYHQGELAMRPHSAFETMTPR